MEKTKKMERVELSRTYLSNIYEDEVTLIFFDVKYSKDLEDLHPLVVAPCYRNYCKVFTQNKDGSDRRLITEITVPSHYLGIYNMRFTDEEAEYLDEVIASDPEGGTESLICVSGLEYITWWCDNDDNRYVTLGSEDSEREWLIQCDIKWED